MSSLAYNLLALVALVPAAVIPLKSPSRGAPFWIAALVAVLGPAAAAAALLSGAWQTSLSATLWVSIAASAGLFALVAAGSGQGWRLAPLLMPYLVVLGVVASVAHRLEVARPLSGTAPPAWLDLHILVGVMTYALLTLAAVASLATFLQERALKRKSPNALTRQLPSVADSERLSGRLLLACEIVLGLGLATGMGTLYFETGSLFKVDHKTLLSLLAFGLIGLLLVGHRVCGVRGRIAARVVLVAYLLLTLAYPGVKFVTQVLQNPA
ncbi:MAG: inner membrane protein YpjD [Actinomycetota bacterium]